MALSMTELADQLRTAMNSNDLEAMTALMAPDVRWGAPDDPSGGCQNRGQVRRWYEAAMGRGVSAGVGEIAVGGGCLLVGLTVEASSPVGDDDGRRHRWLVITVRDGLVSDIRGFDDRAEAAARAGVE